MGKKRAREADGKQAASKDADRMDEDSDDEENFDIVNVEFEWFNFDADVDFHGTKTLLRQLLDVDAPLFDVSGLADLILAQPTIGSTVKVDGKANDAYALVTALSMRELSGKPAMATLTRYLAEKAAAQVSGPPALGSLLPGLLAQQTASSDATAPHVGLVLSERLVNMPAEVAPPMFTMLADEIEAAVEDGEPYGFTHYLVLSKTYQEVQSSLAVVVDSDEEDGSSRGGGRRKKARSSGAGADGASPIFHFHPEDEVLQRHALAYGTYAFTKADEAVADSKRAFQDMGVQAHGLLILIEADKLAGAIKAMGEYLQTPQ
ncbi:hypothetical protein CMQ_3189 [Grosmannia clavigera kw1407]|uniref:Protein BCP1 n=1 Tax=Grosmannia clavigera (strain kw1407 / UAMH 11150) TaxID=655863 RepID=F0XGN3_GROCL|nr:uncharacterized protein CMQ_3189 [Grosmannia clavigera kw1407]EFX03260.1 hypothetical protein CMQ_3189 [Grosmannia clavigera kw1407]